jgi:hypothetical protein
MKRFVCLLLLLFVIFGRINAQSTVYVLQGGLSCGLQKWDNSFDREPLWADHVALAIESVNNDDDRSSLFMQIGYHIKGSALRFRYYNYNTGFPGGVSTEPYKFRNISMILGAKQKIARESGNSRYFYFGGIRGDYTISTNIDELGAKYGNSAYAAILYPNVGYMNRWLFGVSAGVGIEYDFSELIGGEIKLSVHPDFTLQYNQPAIGNVLNPFNPGTTTTISERRIRNTTVELSVGLRLLHKVEIVN